MAPPAKPVGPSPPHSRLQHQLIPQLELLIGIDVTPDVILGALAQYLLVDTCSVLGTAQAHHRGGGGCSTRNSVPLRNAHILATEP